MTAFGRVAKVLSRERKEQALLRAEVDLDTLPLVDDVTAWASAALGSAKQARAASTLSRLGRGSDALRLESTHLSKLARSKLMRRPLEYLFVSDAHSRTMDGIDRLAQLLPILQSPDLGEISRDYLGRVGTLYLWGFEKECFPLARATLESALVSRLGDLDTSTNWQDKNLLDKIKAVGPHRFKLFSAHECELAGNIRRDGNDVLHVAAQHHTHHASAVELISNLGRLLACLFPAADALER